ncbi:anti-sigma factor domain-containing protein [Thermolongibacillus altinsuensis]|uniref:anti-sigma factor domain-containing protein n=1 Tax=Thermolongibacillus altinsuensis TaxID=575256 RepID=UPI00242A2BE6|nr:anti-sigma factor domain-containing protein [Thermolongibacillus altinsuensis]GMB10102.1 anti-sigma-I factor RsgI [Thermolongibacillus altinsuensis]
MKKGIVLEVDDDFVTLLTPDGEFVQIKKEGSYQIGQEIEGIPMRRQKTKKPFFHFSSFKLAVASIAAVCLLVLSLFSSVTSNEVYAYLSIDINPSIELMINKKLEVINVRGYNQDGEKLVANLSDWKEKKFVDVTKKIIELSMKNGYLHKGEEVLITTVEKKANRSSSQRLAKELDEVKRSYQKQDIVVTTKKSTLELRKEAIEKGFTTGKYMRLIEKENKIKNNGSSQNQKENVPVNREQNESNDNHLPPSSNLLKKEQESKQQEQSQLEKEEQAKMKKQVPFNHFVDKEENQEKQELKRKGIQEKKREDREEREERKERKKREERKGRKEREKERWAQKNRNGNDDEQQRIEREHEKEYERENDALKLKRIQNDDNALFMPDNEFEKRTFTPKQEE